MGRDFFLDNPQFLEFFGQLLVPVDNLGIVGEDLSLQFLVRVLSVASPNQVVQTDGHLALTHIGCEFKLAVHTCVCFRLFPIGEQLQFQVQHTHLLGDAKILHIEGLDLIGPSVEVNMLARLKLIGRLLLLDLEIMVNTILSKSACITSTCS